MQVEKNTSLEESKTKKFDHYIILVHPHTPENVGFCARAMKSMGFQNLILVGEKPEPFEKCRDTAVNALEIVDNLLFVKHLDDALLPTHIPVGFAGKSYGKRTKSVMDLEDWAEWAHQSQYPMSLIFGSERNGLSQHDIERCDWVVRIPTHPDQPSLNLSHAVQLVTYALFRRQRRTKNELVPVEELNEWAKQIIFSARQMGFFPHQGAQMAERLLRSLFLRAAPNRWEGEWLKKQMTTFLGLLKSSKINRG